MLSSLVEYINYLDATVPTGARDTVNQQLLPTLKTVTEHGIQYDGIARALNDQYHSMGLAIDQYINTIDQLKQHLARAVAAQEGEYYADSTKMFFRSLIDDRDDYLLNRQLDLSADALEFVLNRVRLYSDWHWPGMVLRPGLEPWVHHLVALDPMYLVDISPGLLEAAQEKFTAEYRRRVRPYLFAESLDRDLFDQLPTGQFGFVLAYNYFNYKPIEYMTKALAEIKLKLRPGGSVAFTFNDCSRAAAVKLVENKFMCYTPGPAVINMLTALGYQITRSHQLDAAAVWIEASIPGELVSLRGGQSLAKIVARSK
jgi:SAM-dependent methyltransferase